MAIDISPDALFVPTDERGRQFHDQEVTLWSLPGPLPANPPGNPPADPPAPGRVIDKGPSEVRLLCLDDLLEELGQRIFLAEQTAGEPVLLGETRWTLTETARFALDCATHALAADHLEVAAIATAGGNAPAEVATTLIAVMDAARKWLDRSSDADTGLLALFSRLAIARRLRRQGDLAGDLALELAVDAEAAGIDLVDDSNWTAAAATREAVLAAIEAVRHESAPHLLQAENTRYEESGSSEREPTSGTFDTPWGAFRTGLRKGVLPAWVAATEAAERARQSVSGAKGAEAAEVERAWQRERLLQALRGQ
ncbi:MAG: hypothetical protein ACYCST_04210 [Acidimicrobiales bacterium]